ncbi:hypothetical protein BE20_17050 [Sorangium cellulosum]|nr:hypothetical protein BE20_17050 [Sorangium cellulosum]
MLRERSARRCRFLPTATARAPHEATKVATRGRAGALVASRDALDAPGLTRRRRGALDARGAGR